jgi:phage terminase small subunit
MNATAKHEHDDDATPTNGKPNATHRATTNASTHPYDPREASPATTTDLAGRARRPVEAVAAGPVATLDGMGDVAGAGAQPGDVAGGNADTLAAVHALPASVRRPARVPGAPRHLATRQARRLWRSTVEGFTLEPHHLALLEEACVCVDRLVAARREIATRGLIVSDRYGAPKANPAVAIERDARIALARLLRELQLGDDADLDSSIRPPRAR